MSFVVPYGAGGGYDTYARLLASHMEPLAGTEIVVSNLASTTAGAKVIRDARPDGRTIGILNGTETMLRRMLEGDEHPDLFADFLLLGQIAETPTVWVAAPGGGIGSIDELMKLAATRPIVAGTRSVSNTDFAGMAVVSSLADFRLESVTGYRGSNEVILSMIRGEVDLVSFSYETLRPFIESGEVRPILQLTSAPLAEAPKLADVPFVGGPGGWLARRAAERGADVAKVGQLGDGLVAMSLQPRTIVTCRGVEPDMAACLKQLFVAAVDSPALRAEATALQRSIVPIPGDELAEKLHRLQPVVAGFVQVIREAQGRARS